MVDQSDGITLGEVFRGLQELRDATRENTKEVSRLSTEVAVGHDKTGRLETIVYGTAGIASAALISSVLALVLRG